LSNTVGNVSEKVCDSPIVSYELSIGCAREGHDLANADEEANRTARRARF
jgi:hypothetical protein